MEVTAAMLGTTRPPPFVILPPPTPRPSIDPSVEFIFKLISDPWVVTTATLLGGRLRRMPLLLGVAEADADMMADVSAAARPKNSNTKDDAEGTNPFLCIFSTAPSSTIISGVGGVALLLLLLLPAFTLAEYRGLLPFPRHETMAPTVPARTQFGGIMLLGDSRFAEIHHRFE